MLSWQIGNLFLLRDLYKFCCQFGGNYTILENHSLHPVFTCTFGHWSGGLVSGEPSHLPNEGGFTWAVKGFSYFPSGNQCFDWLYCLHICFGEFGFFLTLYFAFVLRSSYLNQKPGQVSLLLEFRSERIVGGVPQICAISSLWYCHWPAIFILPGPCLIFVGAPSRF